MTQAEPLDDNLAGPAAPWLALGLLLTGIGTAFLGTVLPYLAHAWQISDAQSGQLIAAKFAGAFLGGLSANKRLRLSILLGLLLGCAGFGAFAMSPGFATGAASLFVSGYGVGLCITATNILIGRRYTSHTGTALATLNFFWSLGAVLCGFLAAWVLPRFALRGPMLVFAALFLMTATAGLLFRSHALPAAGVMAQETVAGIAGRLHLYFAALLLLYGGLETCLTGWLTTYTLRFSDAHLLGGQSAVVLLWSALTVGRMLSSAAMRYVPEARVQRAGLLLSTGLIVALMNTSRSGLLSLECVLLGLSLAPFFPATFGILMRRTPSARQAATIMAASGLGAAVFPWLMGTLSAQTGSLRVAMAVPLTLAILLLGFSLTGALTRSKNAAEELSKTPGAALR